MAQLLQHWAHQMAQLRPEARAVVSRDDTMTYAELATLSDRIARTLADAGCLRGDRVCLLLPKSPLAIAAILGIYKADCIYVPLDTNNPVARLTKIVQSCECACLLTNADHTDKLEALLAVDGFRTKIIVGWLDQERPPHTPLPHDFTLNDVLRSPALPPISRNSTDCPAHILFTSGSTGEPKGVIITHANVLAFVRWAVEYFGIGADERLSAHSPLHFDLSMFDIFGAQAVGAELHLCPNEVLLLPHKLAQWMRDSQLTQWFSVPSQLNYLCKFDAVAHHDFPTLRRLLWCGEVLPTPVLQYWMQRVPHAVFTNLYGPTETTIASSYYTVPKCPSDPRAAIPIGKPCAGEELLVLNDKLQPMPVGEEGGLYIRGAGLARGYWRDPNKTRAAFVAGADGNVDRLYKTGDRAYLGKDGLVYYIGRNDMQIKSRGFRIDLGEIEAALGTLDYVREAAVTAIPDDGFASMTLCCAYVNPISGTIATPSKLRHDLAALLPYYMIPSRWQAVSHLPRNANGKTDRNKLRELFEPDETIARRQA